MLYTAVSFAGALLRYRPRDHTPARTTTFESAYNADETITTPEENEFVLVQGS
jgi:hypothetical protein